MARLIESLGNERGIGKIAPTRERMTEDEDE